MNPRWRRFCDATWPAITSTSIFYGGTHLDRDDLVFALYNHLPRPDWITILKAPSTTSAIYFKIAGTYKRRFALLSGGQGWRCWRVSGSGPRRHGPVVFSAQTQKAAALGHWHLLFGDGLGYPDRRLGLCCTRCRRRFVVLMLAGWHPVLRSGIRFFWRCRHWRFHNTIWSCVCEIASLIVLCRR